MESNLNVNKAEKAIKFFLLAGVFSLIIWKWSLRETFIPKPSELFFALAFLVAAAYFLFLGQWTELKKINKKILFVSGLMVLPILAATLFGYLRYDLSMTLAGVGYLLRLAAGICVFLLVYFFASRDRGFYRKIYLALILAPLVYVPFLLYPPLAGKLSLLSGVRFTGLTQTPTTVALSLFIAFVFLFLYFLQFVLDPKKGKKILYIGLLVLLLIALEWLIMWTWSRLYFGAMWIAIGLGTALMARYYKKSIFQTAGCMFAVAAVALAAIVFSPHKNFILEPFLMTANNTRGLFTRQEESRVLARQAVEKTLSATKPAVPDEKRGAVSIIPDVPALPEIDMVTSQGVLHSRAIAQFFYLEFFKRDILALLFGLGVNYESRFTFVTVIDDVKGVEGAESGVDILLYGGIGLALGLIWLAFIIGKNVYRQIFLRQIAASEMIYRAAPALAMAAYAPLGMFAGMASQLYGFYLWILLALILTDN